eukprot:4291242-Amphidinium_carterae.1
MVPSGSSITMLDLFREIRESRDAVQLDLSTSVKRIEKKMDQQDSRLSKVEADVVDIRKVADEARRIAAQACTTASHTAKSNKGKGKGKPEEESGGIPLLELKRWGRNTPAATIKEDAKRFLQRLAETEPATVSEDVFAPFARCSVCHIRVSCREVGWKMIMATKAAQIPLGEGTAIMSWQAPPEIRRFRGRVSAVCEALKKSLVQLGASAPELEPCWKSGQVWPSTVSQNWAAKVCRHTLTVSFNEQGLAELHHQLTPEQIPRWQVLLLQETSALPIGVSAVDTHVLIHTTDTARPTAVLVHASIAHLIVETVVTPFPSAVLKVNDLKIAF